MEPYVVDVAQRFQGDTSSMSFFRSGKLVYQITDTALAAAASRKGWYRKELEHWHAILNRNNRKEVRRIIATMCSDHLVHVSPPFIIVQLTLPVGKRELYAMGISKCHEIDSFDEHIGIDAAESRALNELREKLEVQIARYVK